MIKMVHGAAARDAAADALRGGAVPHVEWDAGEVELLAEPVELAGRASVRRRAGVSSFGI